MASAPDESGGRQRSGGTTLAEYFAGVCWYVGAGAPIASVKPVPGTWGRARLRRDWRPVPAHEDAVIWESCVALRFGTGGRHTVAGQIPTGEIHHLRLTVTDIERSRLFYTSLLGFEVAVESPPPGDPSAAEVFKVLFGGVVMIRGNLLMGLRPMAAPGDRFDPDHVGLDHLSFGVASHEDLEQAVRLFDEQGVAHGEITRLPSFGIDVLSFEDPDGVQLELTAPVT